VAAAADREFQWKTGMSISSQRADPLVPTGGNENHRHETSTKNYTEENIMSCIYLTDICILEKLLSMNKHIAEQ